MYQAREVADRYQIAWHPEGVADDAEQEDAAAPAHPAAEDLDGAEEDTWQRAVGSGGAGRGRAS